VKACPSQPSHFSAEVTVHNFDAMQPCVSFEFLLLDLSLFDLVEDPIGICNARTGESLSPGFR